MSTKTASQKFIFNEPDHWDHAADVVVVGTGTAMHGAIKMADSGLKVIAVEANSFPGGATGFSGGGAWLPMNKFAVKHGDTKEKAMTYLNKQKREIPIPQNSIEAFVDNTQPMLDFMSNVFEEYDLHATPGGTQLFGDYHAEWEGGRPDAWRSVSWTAEGGMPNIDKWKNAYIDAFKKRGGTILTSTKVTKYVYTYDENGIPEVLGLIAEQNGKEIAIRADKAVLMGPGGFEWNDDLRNSFLASEVPYACSLSTNDGTALKMTMNLGADLINMSECWGMLTFKEKAKQQKKDGVPANIILKGIFLGKYLSILKDNVS